MNKHLRKNSGAFTLIEMIVAMMLLGLLSGVLVSIISVNFNVMTNISERKKLVTRGMLAINLFERELGMMKTADQILYADDDQIKFTDAYGNTWEYIISGTELTRQEIGVGSAQTLAAPLLNAETKFSYFAQDNSGLTSFPLSVGNRALVTLVQLVLVMDHEGSGIPLMTATYPENLKVYNH
ncbi:MAG: prepilin-type N-terminal cleavage/methylation domain-containing protein [Candidatus Marinimicrobia bacterium]|jgi:prepilin-type N-terminal cleavage/methylation domain-containing protein|nr:prepilin-type N-terminal cleavage/methylation domain-containing protein [Candidatus Neomarinimicrobiota bacterium]MBT3631775.1 prepilin-type N-terminal cleavage/methylation domain-containing protein [Candidatus Neomarinimicrobiota bacterium]MBT3825501.1 prepilin-type N-terminal cleavage/methylation domain-containing protein [Candidatus Neomarinimicrobiota bacterium]MBT4132228.1 prepilin-type N-terminal cleavage/methylation domain-containing protein [Candidatus Neomarinimicrobiota bacterium]M